MLFFFLLLFELSGTFLGQILELELGQSIAFCQGKDEKFLRGVLPGRFSNPGKNVGKKQPDCFSSGLADIVFWFVT
jgi:hypothetical protein